MSSAWSFGCLGARMSRPTTVVERRRGSPCTITSIFQPPALRSVALVVLLSPLIHRLRELATTFFFSSDFSTSSLLPSTSVASTFFSPLSSSSSFFLIVFFETIARLMTGHTLTFIWVDEHRTIVARRFATSRGQRLDILRGERVLDRSSFRTRRRRLALQTIGFVHLTVVVLLEQVVLVSYHDIRRVVLLSLRSFLVDVLFTILNCLFLCRRLLLLSSSLYPACHVVLTCVV